MPYPTLVQPGGWPAATNLNPVNFEALIRRIANGIDGDNGGSYAPQVPINLYGLGLTLTNFPKVTFPRHRKIHIPALERAPDYLNVSGTNGAIEFDPAPSFSSGQFRGIKSGSGVKFAFPLSRIQDRTKFELATAYFTVGGSKTILPTVLPTLDVRRTNLSTGVSESIGSGGASVFPTPSSLVAYVNGGVPQQHYIVADTSKALVDVTTYTYFAVWTDETMNSADLATDAAKNLFSAIDLLFTVSDYGW